MNRALPGDLVVVPAEPVSAGLCLDLLRKSPQEWRQ
jgi:hypothetical protein